ncbi:MAG: methyltransferase domain-containing protein [Pseudomonadota bacterium]
METANQEQAEYWSASPAGENWLTYQDHLDQVLQPVLDLVLDRATLRPGDRVVDIGCGAGTSVLAAAAHVGRAGHVLGADISQPFLDRAAAIAAERGITHVDFQCADAQVAQLKGAPLDAAMSRFGVMFFEDPTAAFANIARNLKPGAQITFAAWAPVSENPWFSIPVAAAKERLGDPPKADPDAPGPFAFRDRDRVLGLLQAAGLVDVTAEPVPVHLTPAGDADALAQLSTRIGPATRIMSHFDAGPGDAHAIAATMRDAFAEYATPDGLRVPATINLFQARTADPQDT